MSLEAINGVRLFWEQSGGSGLPLILVHGSWGDHHNWDLVVPHLADRYRVFTYDRRGHSASERPAGQGRIQEDVEDLAAFIEARGLAPANVAGNSFGAAITLKLAASRPELLAAIAVHEPPLLGMIADHPMLPEIRRRLGAVIATLRSGNAEEGARQFVENVALGPGMWDKLPEENRQVMIFNAPTFLDEQNEPETAMTLDLEALGRFRGPALVTRGDQSPPFFGVILDRIIGALPQATRHTFRGGGHVPHLTHAEEFVQVLTDFMQAATARAGR